MYVAHKMELNDQDPWESFFQIFRRMEIVINGKNPEDCGIEIGFLFDTCAPIPNRSNAVSKAQNDLICGGELYTYLPAVH